MVDKVTSPGQGRGPSRHERQKHHLLPPLMKESLSWKHISIMYIWLKTHCLMCSQTNHVSTSPPPALSSWFPLTCFTVSGRPTWSILVHHHWRGVPFAPPGDVRFRYQKVPQYNRKTLTSAWAASVQHH